MPNPYTTNSTSVNRSPLPDIAKIIDSGNGISPLPSRAASMSPAPASGPSTPALGSASRPSPFAASTMTAPPLDRTYSIAVPLDTPSTDLMNPKNMMLEPTRENSYILGTRRSALALVQTEHVAAQLRKLNPSPSVGFPIESMSTVGDRNQTTPLHLLSPYSSTQPAKSLWTDELEARLTAGSMDMIVHSLKDVPTVLKEGCELGAMLEREDPRDAFIAREGSQYTSLEDLPDGSIVGTGSVRRVAQLKRAFPKLRFEDMRGNLNTRLSKLDSPTSPFAALILAIAGLTRIGMQHRITAPLSGPVLMHAVGQGALGIEIRSNDPRTREMLRGIGHWQTEWRCAAERGCLRVLEGGCSVPVGIESKLEELAEGADGHDAEGYAEGDLSPLQGDSPMLFFSGILPSSTPYPTAAMSSAEVAPLLANRKARLSLSICVTSLDGTQHVVYTPEPAIVSSYRSAEAWGEECARELRKRGASEILDEINRERKERERKAAENAAAKAAAAAPQQQA